MRSRLALAVKGLLLELRLIILRRVDCPVREVLNVVAVGSEIVLLWIKVVVVGVGR